MSARAAAPEGAMMKVLSLTQPWAWLVVHGGKNVENRTWTTKFRGRFLIHAAKGMTRDQYLDARSFAHKVDPEVARRLPRYEALERGGIVGVAELVDVLPKPRLCELPDGWRMAGQFGFVLRNVEPLPFHPCKGSLGFWGSFNVISGQVVPA
jgi:hypothetical protein